MTVIVTVLRTRRVDLTLELPGMPEVGRARLITTTALASAFSALFIGAPAYLPGAEMDVQLVVWGILIPHAVGYVTLLLAERRARRELTVAARQQLTDDLAGRR